MPAAAPFDKGMRSMALVYQSPARRRKGLA